MTIELANDKTLKYPILFVHGFGLRDNKRFGYWGRIPNHFVSKGCNVFFGNQDAGGSIEDNALFLKERILEILSDQKCEKINVIAHSKGGLEMRYLISTLKMGDKIASLTTIATPHRGSKALMYIPKITLKTCAFFTTFFMYLIGERKPRIYQTFLLFREDNAEIFNTENPDDPNVYYQSYTSIMDRDFLVTFLHRIIKKIDQENDGIISVDSAKWGEFRGVIKSNSRRGISHFDQVDFRRRKLTKKTGENVSDILEVYDKIFNDLLELNF